MKILNVILEEPIDTFRQVSSADGRIELRPEGLLMVVGGRAWLYPRGIPGVIRAEVDPSSIDRPDRQLNLVAPRNKRKQ